VTVEQALGRTPESGSVGPLGQAGGEGDDEDGVERVALLLEPIRLLSYRQWPLGGLKGRQRYIDRGDLADFAPEQSRQ
jgi:hypothetical protein